MQIPNKMRENSNGFSIIEVKSWKERGREANHGSNQAGQEDMGFVREGFGMGMRWGIWEKMGLWVECS